MTTLDVKPPLQIAALKSVSDRRAFAIILVLSVAVFSFLFWLVYFKPAARYTSHVIAALPAINAGFNSLSTVFLLGGIVAIRNRQYHRHLRFMFAALASSTLFFICYVIYHNSQGDTKFLAHGLIRPIYFLILISHITLSAVAVPLILLSFYLSLSGKLPLHKRVSRVTFPIWLYVSVTGVLVFAMLKIFNH